jgi:hypothetical protein
MARRDSIEEQVRVLALRFAEEVAGAVRRGMAEEVSTRVLEVVRRATQDGARLSLGTRPGDRRIGKVPVPVRCPVRGCKNPGVRAKRNFCADHSAALTETEKKRLREAQLGGAPAAKSSRRGRRG